MNLSDYNELSYFLKTSSNIRKVVKYSKQKSVFNDWLHRGMIYGKVYGRSSVLARFLIEISSHARHNNFSRTCKHERRSRVCSIFSTWTWTIILFDRSASIALNVCIRWSVCEPCSYSFTIHRYVHDNKVVRNCRRAFSYSWAFSWAAARKKRVIYFYKYSESRWNFYEELVSLRLSRSN